MADLNISFVAPKQLVKTVKTALESHGRLNKGRKIRPYAAPFKTVEEAMLIPSTIEVLALELGDGVSDEEYKAKLLEHLGLDGVSDQISIYRPRAGAPMSADMGVSSTKDAKPFTKAMRAHLLLLPPELVAAVDATVDSLVDEISTTYSIYPPMLLLPAHVFSASKWQDLLSKLSNDQRTGLYQRVASSMGVSHIAVNASIPLLSESSGGERENILRFPTNLAPLYGDFGPVCSSPQPTSEDFASAFWVSAKQNGITQVWAPRYSMFSRGNITEKARLLRLASIAASAEQAGGGSAIDLYAGIGYFSFSYAKAGMSKILCFELNPWSVEGFRRGAEANGWGVETIREVDLKNFKPTLTQLKDRKTKFLVFQMSNEAAGPVLQRISGAIPPVRHVNCGLLPSSRASWNTAVRILDAKMGGCIHIHENLAIEEIETKSEEIAEEIQELLGEVSETNAGQRGRKLLALLEHVEKVKTFAPGVMHCVLDIQVIPHIDK